MYPDFQRWDTSSLPSTGSDHVHIMIKLAPPTDSLPTPRPKWEDTNWSALEDPLKNYHVPPPPPNPFSQQLDRWFSSSLDTLTAVIKAATPVSRPSQHSKPWYIPLLTALRKEYSKATRVAKKSRSDSDLQLARLSRNGYFKSIKRERATYWLSLLARTTPQNIWTAKKFVVPRKTPRFPALLGANLPASINHALLDQFFPPRPTPPPVGQAGPSRNPRPPHEGRNLPTFGKILPLLSIWS